MDKGRLANPEGNEEQMCGRRLWARDFVLTSILHTLRKEKAVTFTGCEIQMKLVPKKTAFSDD